MDNAYVHGYHSRENIRLQDQANALVELLHFDTSYPAGSRVLEAGCGVGAQTVTLARNSPHTLITSIDISADSIAQAKRNVQAAGIKNVQFRQADIFDLPFERKSFDHVFVCFVLEHLFQPLEALGILKDLLKEMKELADEMKEPGISPYRSSVSGFFPTFGTVRLIFL